MQLPSQPQICCGTALCRRRGRHDRNRRGYHRRARSGDCRANRHRPTRPGQRSAKDGRRRLEARGPACADRYSVTRQSRSRRSRSQAPDCRRAGTAGGSGRGYRSETCRVHPRRAGQTALITFVQLALAAIPLACALSGCTSIQEAHFQADVATFNNDVALIDSTIATVLHDAGQ